MMQSARQDEDDLILLTFVLIGGLATGVISVGAIMEPVRDWMLQYHLLAEGDQVVIPFVDGVGFGWAQILVVLGVLALVVILIAWLRRRSRDRV